MLLVGCGNGSVNKDTYPQSVSNGFGANYYTYVDSDTGVNYIVFVAGYKGGICPRYNTDGTLYVTPIESDFDGS